MQEVRRVLRIGGQGAIMFADWLKHPDLRNVPVPEHYAEEPHHIGWFYQTTDTAKQLAEQAGLSGAVDLTPNARDCLLFFRADS
jgi:hypothetical protein